VLNIAWVEDALASPARIICPRSTHCPRGAHCDGAGASRAREITDVREEIRAAYRRISTNRVARGGERRRE
jgi:hypothetical protein